ncbi:MAG: hypothetical protein QF722_03275 [Candidatus Thalassarchaeaceae archaeon]|nr:hypothetical protein [Candidatus Thalassarchaeaceae archaeon]
MQARQSRRAYTILIILLASIIPLSIPPSASAEVVCCGANEFELFLIGENNEATMTPFENELVGINEKGVSQSVQGTEEIATWSIIWKQSATIPESTWRFNIAYEVENAAGVYANATVDIRIGSNVYTAESGTPGAFMSGSDVIGIDIEIPPIAVGMNDPIEVTFAVRSMLFTQPGDDSSIRFVWGEDTGSWLRVNLPLVTIDMPNALVVGEEVFFPVLLKSGFGERMWSSLEDFEFKVGGVVVSDVRSPSIVSGGVEVPFVWNPGSSPTDGNYQINLSIWLNTGDIPLTTGRMHDITFEEGGGTQSYHFGEPARAVSSRLDVDIAVKYDGSHITRTVEMEIEGSMASWLRWGMDNIGNNSLPSDHLFSQVQGQSIASNLKENGRVDDSEKEALLNHVDGSTRNLEVFLGNAGLALNPDGLFEADLFDMNPEVAIDLMGVSGIDDAPMKIRIDVVLELSGEERILLISDFIRPQLGTGIWTMNGNPSVDLSVTLTTSAFSGLYSVIKEDLPDNMQVTHYRVGLSEVVTIEINGLSDNDKFEVEYAVAGSALFSPFVSLLATVLLLVSGIVLGLRLTQYRSRWIVGISSFAFSGMMAYVYVLSALPPTFVMGIAAACAVLMVPLAIISPRHEQDWALGEDSLSDDYEKALSREIPTVDCPACNTSNPVETMKRPVRIPCGGCGRNLRIEG